MQKVIIISMALLSLLLVSCFGFLNDKSLSNKKAKDIIEECFNQPPLPVGKIKFSTGKKFFTEGKNKYGQNESITPYRELADKGYITLELIPLPKSDAGYIHYNISLTNKSKDLVIEHHNRRTYVKTYDWEVGEVKEVHEMEALNTAEVKVVYEKVNKTPFAILEQDRSDSKLETLLLKKTSNGWKYCD